MIRSYSPQVRRPMAYVSALITNQVFQRNPWISAWWSAAFPGFGHLILCKYLTGFMLMGWEFFINLKSHLNHAIYLTLTGHVELAKQELDTRWFLLYISVYLYAMWDCYRITIDLNSFGLLADREDSPLLPLNISPVEVNYLSNRSPWNGVIWSFFTPGLGYLYINRLPSAFFLLLAFVATAYKSGLLVSIQATCQGRFHAAAAGLDPQWFLFLPSIMGFAMYDVFIQTKELNKLFKVEQSRFLVDNYQKPKFTIPFGGK